MEAFRRPHVQTETAGRVFDAAGREGAIYPGQWEAGFAGFARQSQVKKLLAAITCGRGTKKQRNSAPMASQSPALPYPAQASDV